MALQIPICSFPPFSSSPSRELWSLSYSSNHMRCSNRSSSTTRILRCMATPEEMKRKSRSSGRQRKSEPNDLLVGKVHKVDKDSLGDLLRIAGELICVLFMYTKGAVVETTGVLINLFVGAWCATCKAMAPKFRALSKKYDDVLFLKLECNEENEPLVQKLGVSGGIPTFKIFLEGEVVREVTDTNFDAVVFVLDVISSLKLELGIMQQGLFLGKVEPGVSFINRS